MVSNVNSNFTRGGLVEGRLVRRDFRLFVVLSEVNTFYFRWLRDLRGLLVLEAGCSKGAVGDDFRYVVSACSGAASSVDGLSVAVGEQWRSVTICWRTIHFRRVFFIDANVTRV